MSQKNLLRDQFHIPDILGTAPTNFSTAKAAGSTINANASPTVNLVQASAKGLGIPTIGTDEWSAYGVYMSPPTVDATPYKCIAHAMGAAAPFLVIGIAPAAPTGTDDEITDLYYMPFNDGIDITLLVAPLPVGDPKEGNPIFVGIGTATAATTRIISSVSCQNLSKPSPRFAASMG